MRYLPNCSKCGLERDGKEPCRPCSTERARAWRLANLERSTEYQRVWRKKNADKMKAYKNKYVQANPFAAIRSHVAWRLRTQFALTPEQWQAMREAQGHRCAICQSALGTGRSVAVDHCHETGLVRGILCSKCNLGLGHFKDNPETLIAAARYIAESRRQVS